MAPYLKKLIKNFFLSRNIHLIKTTIDKGRILDFLAMTPPIQTEHDLVRLGGDGDGGYLVPDDIEGITACFSPGVSRVAAFEEELAGIGIPCFLADYSVDAPPVSNALFVFDKKFLGPFDAGHFISLESWVEAKAPAQSEFLLQMDIEGAEYGVILNTSSRTLQKFRILIIEFHELDTLYDKTGFDLINLTFRKLLQDFAIVHIHPNNWSPPVEYEDIAIPPIMEFTLLRKDRIQWMAPATAFPHRLDRINVPYNPDFALPKCWYEAINPAGRQPENTLVH